MVQTKKVKKLALNSQLLTVQILTNDVQVLILCLSYFITTVKQTTCTKSLLSRYILWHRTLLDQKDFLSPPIKKVLNTFDLQSSYIIMTICPIHRPLCLKKLSLEFLMDLDLLFIRQKHFLDPLIVKLFSLMNFTTSKLNNQI